MFKLSFSKGAWAATGLPSGYKFNAFNYGFQVYSRDYAFTVLAASLQDEVEAVLLLTKDGLINDVVDRVVGDEAMIADQLGLAFGKLFTDDTWTMIRQGIHAYGDNKAIGQNARVTQ